MCGKQIATDQENDNRNRPQKRPKSDESTSTDRSTPPASTISSQEAARNTPMGQKQQQQPQQPISVRLVKQGTGYVATPKASPTSQQTPAQPAAVSTALATTTMATAHTATTVCRPSSDQKQQQQQQTTPRAVAAISSLDDGIDYALSLIKKVRERAGAHPIKPEPERDPSPRPQPQPVRRESAGTTPAAAASAASTRPVYANSSSTSSVKRQNPEPEARPAQPGVSSKAVPQAAALAVALSTRASAAPSSRATTTAIPKSPIVIKEPPSQDDVEMVEPPQTTAIGAVAAAPETIQAVVSRQSSATSTALQRMEHAIYQMSNLPRRRNPALVIFNKDGTLIDFNSMWGGWVESQAWKLEASAKLPIRDLFYGAMGYDWTRRSVMRFGALSTLPKRDLVKVAVDVLVTNGMALAAAQRAVRECWSYPDPVMTCRPLADIPDIFRTIRQMGIKIAIRTTDNRECTKKTLAHLKLTDLVDDMVCGDDGLPAAPAPEQVWTLCNRLGVGAYNTVMVRFLAVVVLVCVFYVWA